MNLTGEQVFIWFWGFCSGLVVGIGIGTLIAL